MTLEEFCQKVELLSERNKTPHKVYSMAKDSGFGEMDGFYILRRFFGLGLIEAKEIIDPEGKSVVVREVEEVNECPQ